MVDRVSATLEHNLQGLNRYLHAQSDGVVVDGACLAKLSVGGLGRGRPRENSRDKPSLLAGDRQTEEYLREERGVVDRERETELSFRPHGDTMRSTFTSQTDRNIPVRSNMSQKGMRLLQPEVSPRLDDPKLQVGTEITDVFKHYDTLSHELSTLYSDKLRVARDEVRRETEKSNTQMLKREEAENRARQVEEENRYLRGELDIERKKLRDKESELRKLRREKISLLRSENLVKESQSFRETQEQLELEVSKRSELEQEMEIMQSTLTQTIKERDLFRDEVHQLKITSKQAQIEMSSSQAVREELESVLRQIQKDRSEMNTLLHNLSGNKDTVESLTQKYERLEIKYQETRDENDKLAEALNEISQEAGKVPQLVSQVGELHQKLKAQHEELKSQTSAKADLEKNMKLYKDKVETMMGLNDFMEKSLRDAEERGKKILHDKHDEFGNLKDRVQQMVSDNLRLKKRISELEGSLEIAEVEAEQSRKREDDLTDQVTMLHEDLMVVSAQVTAKESGQQQSKKENIVNRKMIQELEAELDYAKFIDENSGRVIKAYEILLGDIASKVEEANGPSLAVPTVNIEKFSGDGERDKFMAMLCAFEDGVKLALEGSRNSRTPSIKESRKDRSPKSRVVDSGVYAELLEKLKASVIESLSLVEDMLSSPESLHELSEVMLEYCNAKLNLKKQEERLLEKELLMNHSTVKLIYLGQNRNSQAV